MIAEVYDALKSAGADEDKARAAAPAVAGQWEIEPRLDRLDPRLDRVEERLARLEGRFNRLELRVVKVESDLAVLK
jgi:hypothetical protein